MIMYEVNDEKLYYIEVMAASKLAILTPRLKRWGRLGLADVVLLDEADEEEAGEFDLGVSPAVVVGVSGK